MDSGRTANESYRDSPECSMKFREPEIFVHRLKVEEAMASDAGKNIARIDASSLILMGIKPGNVLIFRGQNGRKAAARCHESIFLEMEPVIRIDKIMRYNLGTEIGESLAADSILQVISDPRTCNEVILEPISFGVPAAVDERYIGRALDGVTITEGQIIVIPYFGGRWYPYAVSKISDDLLGSVDGMLIGPKTNMYVEWKQN